MTTTIDLAQAGVISKLSIRQWSGRRGDKQAGRETAARNHADEKMVRVSKCLIPSDALEPIKRLTQEVRTYHYDNTIVWAEGAQFLPSRLSVPYSAAMQEHRLRFEDLASDFFARYPSLVEAAPEHLGGLFCPEDYPTPQRMRSLFGLEISYEPVPEAGHFLAELASTTLAEYRRNLERKNEERERAMRRDLWERLREPVAKMAEALSDPDKIFRDTLVGNVHDIAERIDSLNVFEDPGIATVAATLRETLATLDPDRLRTSPPDRTAAAQEARSMADRIAESMSGFMSLGLAA
jgi:hypothetical protein